MEVMKTNKLTDVSTRVTCSRPSRRRELYSLPWDRRRHSDHRRRVQSAGPRIDNTPPASSVYTHVRSDNTLIHNDNDITCHAEITRKEANRRKRDKL